MKKAFVLLPILFGACAGLPKGNDLSKTQILAHRGVHQTYHTENLDNNTCTATRIDPPTHDFMENTIPSLLETIKLGADIIEIDIHPTTDNDFAVFHDWTIDCRTEGKGVTREQSMAYLRTLDVGYGYTADGGKTFPLRGKGVGLMPNLEEVLAATGDTVIFINIKSKDITEGEKLAAYLEARKIPKSKVIIFGHDNPVNGFKSKAQGFRTITRSTIKECGVQYMKNAWRNGPLDKCENGAIFVPFSHRHLMPGYYSNMVEKLAKVNALVFIGGKAEGLIPKGMIGIDDPSELKYVPKGAAVYTNKIEKIAPAIKAKP